MWVKQRARHHLALIGITGLLVAAAVSPAYSTNAPDNVGSGKHRVPVSETGSYIVVMDGDPVVRTEGQDNVDSARGKARGRQLRTEHRRAAASAGIRIINDYTVALNGFSATMSHQQAQKLAARDDVTLVLADEMHQPTTDSSGEFLGLTAAGGAYDSGVKGDGVVVGVIDTGIWPEHPSFADDGSYPAPPVTLDDSERPNCEFGNTAHNPADAAFACNDKLIGARQMLDTYRALVGAEDFEFDSARDDNGHGTHTSSTSAGNADVPASVGPHDLGTVTGIAPRAHIVMYKGLGDLGGFSSDLAAAIDQAVADGVDVINYSIGGGASLTGADDIAFLFAADAGVFVATSAGNSGPGAGTIGGPASVPWLTSVGASTQTRFWQGTVELGNGATYTGASLTAGVGSAPLVDAAAAHKKQKKGDDLCRPGSLNPGLVRRAIVLCRRGAIARVDKSLAVLQAGGVGMIMYENTDSGDRFTDNHHVPSVHIDNTPGLAIKEYIASQPPRMATARITDTATAAAFAPAPSMTSFSSRGPDPVADDIIKPDVTAPGMQILAGASPYADPGGNLFQSIAGTSMSSPHVAGLFALLKQQHPNWSAAAAKSALMTTASQDVRDNDRVSLADPFDMGAGHVNPGSPTAAGSSFNPGLVYDAGFFEYLGFLCDKGPEVFANPEATCGFLESIGVPTTAANLNVPSIGVSSVPGSKTVQRTVTSVAAGTETFTVSVEAPEGFDIEVSPSSFELAPGESQTYTVTIVNLSAPIGEWRHGSLTWTAGSYAARSPISVKGTLFEAPAVVTGEGESGTVSFDISFGYTGNYTAAGHGLTPATVFQDDVTQDPDQTFQPSDVGNGAVAHQITVSGSARLRLAIPPDAVTDPDIDIDLFVYDSAGNQVASSTNGATDELIDLEFPADDTYTVYVHGWQTLQPPGGGTTPVTLYAWDISATPGGSLVIDSAPAAATRATTGTVQASWTGATLGQWHLGAVSHSDADGPIGLTLVEVDNRSAP
ncbi:MAG: S8 family peptidase [Micromonosporaceae bacterium]